MTTQDVPRPTTDIAAAARSLGVSVETLRKRLQRGTVAGFKAEDGTWRVFLDESGQPAIPPVPRPAPRTAVYGRYGGSAAELRALRQELAALHDRVEDLIELVQRLRPSPPEPQDGADGSDAPELGEEQVRQVLLAVLQFLRRSRDQ